MWNLKSCKWSVKFPWTWQEVLQLDRNSHLWSELCPSAKGAVQLYQTVKLDAEHSQWSAHNSAVIWLQEWTQAINCTESGITAGVGFLNYAAVKIVIKHCIFLYFFIIICTIYNKNKMLHLEIFCNKRFLCLPKCIVFLQSETLLALQLKREAAKLSWWSQVVQSAAVSLSSPVNFIVTVGKVCVADALGRLRHIPLK